MPAARRTLLATLAFATALSAVAQDDTSDRKRAISNNLASAIADTMPKYNPPPLEKEEEKGDDGVDEELMLKPKNGIVRLPQVVVEGRRPAIFTERELNTDKGLAAIATQRYFSDTSQALNKFHIPFLTLSQEDLAMEMWKEDERLRLIGEIQEHSDNALLLGNEKEAAELKALSNDTLGRRAYLPDASALHRETKGN